MIWYKLKKYSLFPVFVKGKREMVEVEVLEEEFAPKQ